MSWRLEINHRTGYEYEGEVNASYNRARLTPTHGNGQLLLDHTITVDPSVPLFSSLDYWGTRVHAFDVHEPHRRLDVVGRSLVETATASIRSACTWEALETDGVADRYCEFLAPSTMTQADDAIEAFAADFRTSGCPGETIDGIVDWVRTNIRYERGITNVSTPAAAVFAALGGVCQDFAHLTITLLRSVGIPARYVSGYLHPDATAEIGSTAVGESHAWVEAFTGSWCAIDPTNGDPVGSRHVRIAHGRDYLDVAPLVGIYHGAPSKALVVSVELVRHA